MYKRPNIREELNRFVRQKTALNRLIMINLIIWLVVSAILVITFLFKIEDEAAKDYITRLLALPASVEILGARPWTLITYMFLHINFWHILFNLLWLYWFGKIFMEFLSGKHLVIVYLLGGISGGLLYILAFNIFPVFSEAVPEAVALGASASVMAIVTAISFYVPNYYIHLLFIGPVRIYYIAIILFVLDFFMIRSGNAGGHLAHIGGAIFGVAYAAMLKKGIDLSRLIKFPGRSKSTFRKSRPGESERFRKQGERPLSDEEYNSRKVKHEEKIDIILDKISKSGYDSLSKEEKEYLFKESRRG